MTSPGEETREFYRQQGYAEGFQVGYDAGNEMMAKAIATAELLERKRIIKLLEVLWQKTQGTDLPAVVVLPGAIDLIMEKK